MFAHYNHMHILQKYVDSLVVKDIHQKGTCYNKLGLCAQILDIIVSCNSEHNWKRICNLAKLLPKAREHNSIIHLDRPPIYGWIWLSVHL